jgi:hypothetical protein
MDGEHACLLGDANGRGAASEGERQQMAAGRVDRASEGGGGEQARRAR